MSAPGSIDLNADLGEEEDEDLVSEEIMDFVTSASVACGFHAGNSHVMHRTVEAAARHGVVIGAHPSYDDREGFGRVAMDVESGWLTDDLLYQIGALDGVARRSGARLRYVKPHGALYNRMAVDEGTALAVCDALRVYGGLALLAPPGSVALSLAEKARLEVATEVFADRAYMADGTLVPRDRPGAVLTEPSQVARRAVSLATQHRVETVEGDLLELAGSSICVHGDTPGALAILREVRAELSRAGVAVTPFLR